MGDRVVKGQSATVGGAAKGGRGGARSRRATRGEDVAIAVGFGCVLATLLVHTSSVSLFQRFPNAELFAGPASHATLLASLAVSLLGAVALVVARRVTHASGAEQPVPDLALAVAAGVAYLAGSVAFCLLPGMGEEALPRGACDAVGAVAGLGCAAELVAWGRILRRYALVPAAASVSCAVLVQCAVDCLVGIAPLAWVPSLFVACALVAVAVPVVLAARGSGRVGRRRTASASAGGPDAAGAVVGHADPAAAAGTAGAAGAPAAAAGPASVRQAGASAGVRGFVSVLAAPAIGLVLFAMIMSMRAQLFVEDMPYYLGAQALVAAALLACAAVPRLRGVIPIAYRSVIPALAVVVLAFCSASIAINGGSRFDIRLVFLLYCFAGVLTLVTLAGVAHAAEFPSDLIVLVAAGLFALVTLGVGWFMRFVGQPEIRGFVMVVTGLYAVAMTLYSLARSVAVERGMSEGAPGALRGAPSWEGAPGGVGRVAGETRAAAGSCPAGPTDAVGAGGQPNGEALPGADGRAQAPSLERRCDQIAERCRLTNREREVLGYLAQGHSAVYVSEVLLISPNTARTHVHNIYRKLGVASREEVLLLVRGQGGPGSDPGRRA